MLCGVPVPVRPAPEPANWNAPGNCWPDEVTAPGFGSVGFIHDNRFHASVTGVVTSHRKPRFTVSRELNLMSSCTYEPKYLSRMPTSCGVGIHAPFAAPR